MRPWLDELDLYARLLNFDQSEYGKLISPARRNPKLAATVRRFLRLRLLRAGINPDDPPVFVLPRDLSRSDYPLGRAKCGEVIGDEVGLSQQDIQAGGGIGIFGLSGTGKSTLAKLLILSFLDKKNVTDTRNTAVVLDLHGEFRSLLNFYSPEELVWLTADELGLNPFQVPTRPNGRLVMSPQKWIGSLKEWMRLGWLGEVSVNFFAMIVTKVYKDRGIFNGSDNWPSLSDVLEATELEDAPKGSDKAKAREKTIDRLSTIKSMLPGLNVRKSRNVHQLFGRSVILDLTDVRDSALPLLFNFLIMLLTASFTQEPDEPIRRLLVMEESHLYLAGETDKRMGDLKESAGTGVLRSLRKAGFCGIVVNQLISDLAPAVVGNLSSVICMRLTQRACISRAASVLGLERWQERELARLPAREAIMRVSRHPEPIHLLVKDIESAQNMEESQP